MKKLFRSNGYETVGDQQKQDVFKQPAVKSQPTQVQQSAAPSTTTEEVDTAFETVVPSLKNVVKYSAQVNYGTFTHGSRFIKPFAVRSTTPTMQPLIPKTVPARQQETPGGAAPKQ